MNKRKSEYSQSYQTPPALRNYFRPSRRGYLRRRNRGNRGYGATNSASLTMRNIRPYGGSLFKIYQYRQWAYNVTISQVASPGTTIGGLNFVLNIIPGVASFAGLYDQYRVDYMEFTFRARYPCNDMELASAEIPPLIYVAIDRDDAGATSITDLQQYQTLQIHPSSDAQFTMRFRPGIRGMVWDGAAAQPGGSVISPWLDVASDQIPHYGIKYAITSGSSTQTAFQSWDVDLNVGLSFRSVR